MKKTIITILCGMSLFFTACGFLGGVENKVSVKYDGQEKTFEPTSTFAYHNVGTVSYSENGQTVSEKHSSTNVVLANYELDTSRAFISLGKQKINAPEQIRVGFTINGEKDSDQKTPVQTGTYTADAKYFQKVDSINVYYFADGQQKTVDFKERNTQGKVEITSVNEETISGTIDVSDGDNSIKGGFTAKLYKR